MDTSKTSMKIQVCEVCHYTYMPAAMGDIARHRKYHNEFVYGVRAKTSKSDSVIEQFDDLKILLVSPVSPYTQRKRAERIAFRVKRETYFDFASYHADETEDSDSPLVFIGVTNERAVAFLVVRKNTKSVKVRWDFYDKEDRGAIPLLPSECWSVSMVWTLPNNRRKGFATNLISIASQYLNISVLEMAWATPFTKFGYPLAKKISPNEVTLTV